MAIKYARLFDPVNQFVRKDGIPNSGGSISVFYEGTDDRAELRDEDGTVLNNPLTLDADGRALGTFVDAARVYRLEVDDAYGAEQFTVRKMVPCGGSAGSALGKEYNVVSTDGTVTVVPYVDAGVVTFDLSTNYGLEGSRWGGKLCLRAEISEADVWEEIQTVSTNGNIAYSGGWYPGHAGAFDLEASVEMAEGVPGALNTVEIMCTLFVGGVQVETQYGIIDPSLPRDRVSFGFKGYALEDEKVDCKFYAKSSAAFSVGLAGRAFYNDEVDGIIGGGGGNPGYSAGEGISIDTANVISVTGMLPESASSQFAPSGNYAYASSLSGKMDASASSMFQPSGDYAYNSGLSGKMDATASSMFQPSGDYAYNSSLSSKLDATASSMFAPSGNYQSALTFGYDGTAISSIDGSSLAGMGGHEYSGVFPVVVDNTAETIALDSTGLSIDSTLSAYQSGDEVVIGVNTGMFAPSGDYAYNSSISSFVDSAYVESAVSGKQDASAMTAYQPSGDYAYNSSLSSKLDATASSMFAPSGDYAYESAVSSKLDASASSQFQPSGDYAYESSVSSKLDASASGEFYLTGNPSAFVDSAYVEGQVSGKMDATAASGFYTTANESGFVDSAYVESSVSGKQDVSGMSAYQDVAGMTAYQPSGDYIYASALGIAEV